MHLTRSGRYFTGAISTGVGGISQEPSQQEWEIFHRSHLNRSGRYLTGATSTGVGDISQEPPQQEWKISHRNHLNRSGRYWCEKRITAVISMDDTSFIAVTSTWQICTTVRDVPTRECTRNRVRGLHLRMHYKGWDVSTRECTTKSEMSPLENVPQSEMSPQREGERKSVSSREFTTKSIRCFHKTLCTTKWDVSTRECTTRAWDISSREFTTKSIRCFHKTLCTTKWDVSTRECTTRQWDISSREFTTKSARCPTRNYAPQTEWDVSTTECTTREWDISTRECTTECDASKKLCTIKRVRGFHKRMHHKQ